MSDGEHLASGGAWTDEQVAEFQRRWDGIQHTALLREQLPARTRARLAVTRQRDRALAWMCGHGLWRVASWLWWPGWRRR